MSWLRIEPLPSDQVNTFGDFHGSFQVKVNYRQWKYILVCIRAQQQTRYQDSLTALGLLISDDSHVHKEPL
jgi:hypothetical protein